MIALNSDTAGRVRVRTTIGIPVGTRPRLSPEACARVRYQLEHGPFLAAFDAGIYEASAPIAAPRFERTIIGMPAPHLTASIDDDTVVVDDPDA